MRLIDADELFEQIDRNRIDSRELILKMIVNAPTIRNAPILDMAEIKHCPFCGRKPHVMYGVVGESLSVTIACNCGTNKKFSSPIKLGEDAVWLWTEVRDEAIKKWNTRSQDENESR